MSAVEWSEQVELGFHGNRISMLTSLLDGRLYCYSGSCLCACMCVCMCVCGGGGGGCVMNAITYIKKGLLHDKLYIQQCNYCTPSCCVSLNIT